MRSSGGCSAPICRPEPHKQRVGPTDQKTHIAADRHERRAHLDITSCGIFCRREDADRYVRAVPVETSSLGSGFTTCRGSRCSRLSCGGRSSRAVYLGRLLDVNLPVPGNFLPDTGFTDSRKNWRTGMDDYREDRIRQRAHQLWENAGRPERRTNDYRAQAEQEIDHADSTASPHQAS